MKDIMEEEKTILENIRDIDDDYAEILQKMADDIRDNGGDKERTHYEADQMLLRIIKAFGFTKTADSFEELPKWYA